MKTFKFTINGTKYEVAIKDFEDNVAQIEVNGTTYNVEVDQEIKQPKTPTLVRSKVPVKKSEGRVKKAAGGAGTPVKAPLPGSIIKVLVSEGDQISKGDNLLIMEAMKMENNVLAEKDGVVKSVKVAVGDTVLQDDLLLEIG